jgi:hypothetical protein
MARKSEKVGRNDPLALSAPIGPVLPRLTLHFGAVYARGSCPTSCTRHER